MGGKYWSGGYVEARGGKAREEEPQTNRDLLP